MTPEQFINTWTKNDLTERAGAQSFVEDLCTLLSLDKPRSSADFCYEKGALKDDGGQACPERRRRGWADVWKRDHFGWENKKPGRDLKTALAQLREYAGNLGNPPLLIVCDRERIEIHTAFRGYPDEPRVILLKDIGDAKNQQILRWVFTNPDKLKPLKSDAAITKEAASKFSQLADAMRDRGLDAQQVAHFLTQCIFCMYAEDEGLLNASFTDDIHIFTNLLKASKSDPGKAISRINNLFTAMQKQGGVYGNDDIAWFNGGLFFTIEIPELTASDLDTLYHAAADIDWRGIDPTIFGTLFERGLDPDSRAQLGAHYTDVATINKLIEPIITRPLTAEWQAVKAEINGTMAKAAQVKTAAAQKQHHKTAENLYYGYLERLRNFKVLDAACGSGNFLYLALHALKDLEHIAQLDAEALGLKKQLTIECGTENILGIEVNEYAAELARITVWIGDIQWCQRNGRPIDKNPILSNLDGIQHRDALISQNNTETDWPEADVIVGNPPFLGDKMMRGELGDDYVSRLRNCYKGHVPGGADLVCYWFDKARRQIEQGKAKAAGLVATNSIRGGANRTVLDNICKSMPIFEAWPDEDWFDNGTAVRVSLVCFGHQNLNDGNPVGRVSDSVTRQTETTDAGLRLTANPVYHLAGLAVALIHADLTAGGTGGGVNITLAKTLENNIGISFQGPNAVGPWTINGSIAREWLKYPNVHGKLNSDVVFPWKNARAIVGNITDEWIIDFGLDATESEASLFEKPFDFVKSEVYEARKSMKSAVGISPWLHQRPRPELRKALSRLSRFIVTPQTSKYRIFCWLPIRVQSDVTIIVIARSDDTTFGILHSRFHELWSLRLGTSLEDRPRYTPTTCFETFPFPPGLTPKDTSPIMSRMDKRERIHQRPVADALPASATLSTELIHATTVPPRQDDPGIINDFSAPVAGLIADASRRSYAQAIAEAAFKLNQLRSNWLNPPEWVDWVITPEEEQAGFPKRPVAKHGFETELKKRTLTNLYNARPGWLDMAHKALDKAVANAYGWDDYTPDMPDAEILRRLLKLNLAR